jgi:hypothetical protein
MNVEIGVRSLAADWVLIQPGLSKFRKEVERDRLPDFISQALIDYLSERPEIKVRSTLGIVEGGTTVSLHVWFDLS